MNYLNLIILILVSILFSAFFSGMEIAFVSSNKLRSEIDRKQKKAFAGLVSYFTKQPSRFIATMLVGNNISLGSLSWGYRRKCNDDYCDEARLGLETVASGSSW